VPYNRILVRATNWLGDAVMSLPALRALRQRFPQAEIAILAKPWVADLYQREPFCDRMIPYTARTLAEKWASGRALAREKFDCAILLQNAFEAAAVAYLAGIPDRIGYARDGRSPLLTRAIPVPRKGEIPRHERFYYLELLHRAGILDSLPENDCIRLDAASQSRAAGLARFHELGMGGTIIGISPGAAYGTAKRWLPTHFAALITRATREAGVQVALVGAAADAASTRLVLDALGTTERAAVIDLTGATSLEVLAGVLSLAASCVSNDSGAMHLAGAVGTPLVALFGPTREKETAPLTRQGGRSEVPINQIWCRPCMLRECPFDHQCMTGLRPERVFDSVRRLMGTRQ